MNRLPVQKTNESSFDESNEAINALKHFEEVTLRSALENKYPGSANGLWLSSVITFESDVPVLVDISEKDNVINILADAFQVSKDKVSFRGTEDFKLKKSLDKPRSDNYQPYKTVERLVFHVDWHDTKDPDLVKYRDYTRKNMANQGVQWENELLEGINKPTQDRIGNFALDVLVDRRYGNAKFTDIADIEVGPDYLDIVFDFDFKEEEVLNGLSGNMSKVVHPTPTEIEVTEKRIDKFMTEQFPDLFFRYYKVTPFFRIVADEHRWLDKNALACMYDIIQFNERK